MFGKSKAAAPEGPSSEPRRPQTVRELLEMMPQGFNPGAAAGLAATYQFEVSGSENFTAHLRIAHQQAIFHEGPAVKPEVVVKTPADVWLAVCRGELDGTQAFMSGKFKVEGDLSLLMKLPSLFSREPA
jgi:putative sterol carrier protein